MATHHIESLHTLRAEVRLLRDVNNRIADRLRAETERRERAERSAKEAWQFAKVALKTGRPVAT